MSSEEDNKKARKTQRIHAGEQRVPLGPIVCNGTLYTRPEEELSMGVVVEPLSFSQLAKDLSPETLAALKQRHATLESKANLLWHGGALQERVKSMYILRMDHLLDSCTGTPLSTVATASVARKAESAVETLLIDVKQACGLDAGTMLTKPPAGSIFAVRPELVHAYICRASVRFALGNLSGSVDDANEALAVATSILQRQRSTDSGGTLADLLSRDKALMLALRGTVALRKREFDAAYTDFRAANAITYLHPQALGEGFNFNKAMLGVLALRNTGRPRPHYSPVERRRIEQELHVNIYSSCCRLCRTCGEVPEGLKLCKGCQKVYYCNRQCQRNDWPSHKKWCKQWASEDAAAGSQQDTTAQSAAAPTSLAGVTITRVSCVPTHLRAGIEQEFADKGFALLTHRTGDAAIIRDPKTNSFYEVVSDTDVQFL